VSRPLLRWVLAEGATEPLGVVVERLGTAAHGALAEGRVFVDGRRANDPALEVTAGSAIEVHASRRQAPGVAILAEHAGLVFVSKPCGVATEPDHAGIPASVVGRVAELLDLPHGALHAVSRLDVGVSGVVTLARDEPGRRLAADLRATGSFRRRYIALAPRAPEPASGTWNWALSRSVRDTRRGQARHGDADHDRAAQTHYATMAETAAAYVPGRAPARVEVRPALLAFSPVTGRTHQLRLHAARAGTPLLGDAAHGGARRLLLSDGSVRSLERVFLHAAWVEFAVHGERFHVESPISADLVTLWETLGGAADAWQRALEIALPDVQG
jgi:23S rRNA pseudouridine1911/1915/1917 synthase